MFELNVSTEFCAAHALVIGGVREALHGHNFRVVAAITGPELDADGLLCDFHTVQDLLGAILEPFQNRNLNEVAPFDRLNPSAEEIARHIAHRLHESLDGALSPYGAKVSWVSVTEAPGCLAIYRAL